MLCLCLVLMSSANRFTLPGFCEFTPIMCSNRGSHGGREEMQVCSRCHVHYRQRHVRAYIQQKENTSHCGLPPEVCRWA
ncbi:hypothetical protein F5141DRAFT_97835 [Pisolithus sp. B1]|nr:hypothetical protein F5141DRAFT_97835 [Pisolithus sp. B1]